MHPPTTFDVLRRRRWFVVAAAVVSIAAFLFVAFQVQPGFPPKLKSRQHDVGIATARVLVDTPSSIVADLNPNGGASLSVHSQLLANLVASQAVRAAIARASGVPEEDLVIRPPSIAAPVQTPIVKTVVPASGASMVSLAADQTLPVVAINTQAPTVEQAARLANGTVVALRSYLLSVDTAQKIPPSRRVVITPLGVAQAATATQGRSPVIGLAAALVLFVTLCYGFVIVSNLRARRSPQPASASLPSAIDGAPSNPAQAAEFARAAVIAERAMPVPHDAARGNGAASAVHRA